MLSHSRDCFMRTIMESSDSDWLPQLKPSSNLSAYTEIINAEKYGEYVVFACIACPALLFSPDTFELLKQVRKQL